MSHSRPTLRDLRSTVQKGRHREIGNWLARNVARPSAIYGTWVAVRLGLSANHVTLTALVASLAGAVCIGAGSRWGLVAGVVCLHLGFWLDHVDGQVARWRQTAGLDGVYFDYMMHHVANLALGFALGFGLAVGTDNHAWSLAGFGIAAGWALLSLHNDCRYKAFFQRLKSASQSFRVDGGSGGRPSPAARWPRQGLAALTWPAYKLCEPHVVLVALTLLAALACVHPTWWLNGWRVAAGTMAILAPTLGAARVARALVRGTTEAEFAAWFRPQRSRESAPRIVMPTDYPGN